MTEAEVRDFADKEANQAAMSAMQLTAQLNSGVESMAKYPEIVRRTTRARILHEHGLISEDALLEAVMGDKKDVSPEKISAK